MWNFPIRSSIYSSNHPSSIHSVTISSVVKIMDKFDYKIWKGVLFDTEKSRPKFGMVQVSQIEVSSTFWFL